MPWTPLDTHGGSGGSQPEHEATEGPACGMPPSPGPLPFPSLSRSTGYTSISSV